MSLTVSIALVVILVTLYVIFLKWRQTYWTRQGAPQLPPSLPFGNFSALATGKQSSFDFFKDLYFYGKKSGYKFLGVYSFSHPDVVVIDRDLIKTVLIKDFEYFGSHGRYNHKNEPLTIHLFNMEGPEWRERRVKMSPLFTTGKLKGMFGILAEKSTKLSEYLGKHADQNKPANIKDVFARYTTDNITSVAFGIDTDSFKEEKSFFRTLGDKIIVPSVLFTLLRTILPMEIIGLLGVKVHDRQMTNTFVKTVKDIITLREESSEKRNDFMELMIQMKNHGISSGKNDEKLFMTEQEIISESFLFFFAGFDTSSSTTTFAVWELALHPEYQDKLRKEINDVLAKHNGELTYDALSEMTYLDKVVKETLRLYPIVTVVPRMCTKSYKIPGTNVIVEKGSRLHVPICGLQRDPEYYDNPDEFNPDNFSPEKESARPDFTWLPFGYGPRQCLGMRLGLIQAKLGVLAAIKNFKFTPHESMKPPYVFRPGSILLYFKNDPILNFTRI